VSIIQLASETLIGDMQYDDLIVLEVSSMQAFVCSSQLDVLLTKWYTITIHENRKYSLDSTTDTYTQV
jgi:hypothetical protein